VEFCTLNTGCQIVLVHLGFRSKVFPGFANSLKCPGGILHSRVSDINFGIVGGWGRRDVVLQKYFVYA